MYRRAARRYGIREDELFGLSECRFLSDPAGSAEIVYTTAKKESRRLVFRNRVKMGEGRICLQSGYVDPKRFFGERWEAADLIYGDFLGKQGKTVARIEPLDHVPEVLDVQLNPPQDRERLVRVLEWSKRSLTDPASAIDIFMRMYAVGFDEALKEETPAEAGKN